MRWFCLVTGLWLCLSACASCRITVPDDGDVTVVSYNVENLFDARLDGTEYDDFRPEAGWDEDDVARRLRAVAGVIDALRPRPDVLVLVEIENRRTLDRLLDDYLTDLPLDYRAVVRGAATATGVAVASRYPITDVRALLARSGETPPLRPIMETRVDLGDRDLVVFANHWKSKRGSAPATEPLRRAGARLLADRLRELADAEPGTPVIVAGDLNEQPDELLRVGAAYPTALAPLVEITEWDTPGGPDPPDWYDAGFAAVPRWILLASPEDQEHTPRLYRGAGADVDAGGGLGQPAASGEDTGAGGGAAAVPVLLDPWATLDAGGSYWYYGHWERIDFLLLNHAAAAGALVLEEFQVVTLPQALTDDGWPRDAAAGGASDHLPVMAVFSRP